MDADERGMSVVVCQDYEVRHHPVAFLSRLLRLGEPQMTQAELYLAAARWAVQKFKWYGLTRGLVVYLPEEELVKLIKLRDVSPKVRVFLLDLELYRVEFRCGKGTWAYSQALLDTSEL